MKPKRLARPTLFFSALLVLPICATGQQDAVTGAKLEARRDRLADIKPGATREQVLQALGKPDEVRIVPKGGHVDGVSFPSDHVGDRKDIGDEEERWAYGVLEKGKFAAVGIVSLDANGKVLHAQCADYNAGAGKQLPKLVRGAGDDPAEGPQKASCRIGAVELIPARGETPPVFKSKATLKNPSDKPLDLPNNVPGSLQLNLLVEVYDAKGTLLFRHDHRQYCSPMFEPGDLVLPAKGESTEDFHFLLPSGFGALPPGKYSVRVYYPFGDALYASNRVSFEVR